MTRPLVLLWLGLTGCSSARDGQIAVPGDTTGVVVPTELAGFCRPGPKWTVRHKSDPRSRVERVPWGRRVKPVRRVFSSYRASLGVPLRCVIRTQDEWQAFGAAAAPGLADRLPPAPAVDFDREVLLAALMGVQNTIGHSIDIRRVLTRGDSVVAVVRQTIPPGGCDLGMEATAPMDVVSIPRSDRPVRFFEEVRTAPYCSAQ